MVMNGNQMESCPLVHSHIIDTRRFATQQLVNYAAQIRLLVEETNFVKCSDIVVITYIGISTVTDQKGNSAEKIFTVMGPAQTMQRCSIFWSSGVQTSTMKYEKGYNGIQLFVRVIVAKQMQWRGSNPVLFGVDIGAVAY